MDPELLSELVTPGSPLGHPFHNNLDPDPVMVPLKEREGRSKTAVMEPGNALYKLSWTTP